ncbi:MULTISPECIES: hypothetical protein [unclassified Streptomyces]|uniref:hypothetical protein n=1 Tax=unclassified Streptomyces TaxID=2593676 RepID=UPI002F90F154
MGDPLSEDLVEVPLLGEEGEYQWWRFWIHARGRDATSEAGDIHAEEGDTVLEQHLVQIWAAPQAPETRHRLTDEVGRRRRTASPEEYEAAKAAEAAHAAMPPTPPEEMPMAPVRAELHTRTPDTPADCVGRVGPGELPWRRTRFEQPHGVPNSMVFRMRWPGTGMRIEARPVARPRPDPS